MAGPSLAPVLRCLSALDAALALAGATGGCWEAPALQRTVAPGHGRLGWVMASSGERLFDPHHAHSRSSSSIFPSLNSSPAIIQHPSSTFLSSSFKFFSVCLCAFLLFRFPPTQLDAH